jgi:hypothetical protein
MGYGRLDRKETTPVEFPFDLRTVAGDSTPLKKLIIDFPGI